MAPPTLGLVFRAWFGYNGASGGMIAGVGSKHWNDGPATSGVVHTPIQVPGAIGESLSSRNWAPACWQSPSLSPWESK